MAGPEESWGYRSIPVNCQVPTNYDMPVSVASEHVLEILGLRSLLQAGALSN